MSGAAHELRKIARFPHVWYMRRKETELTPFTRAMLEQSSYRKSAYDFLRAGGKNRDLLVDVGAVEGSIVFDVGAYIGDWTHKVESRSGATVYAFEPNPVVKDRLHQRFEGNPRVTILDYGLGAHDFTATLSLAGPGSTVHAGSAPSSERNVHIRDVLTVLEELGLDRLDVLKLNIEGGEYDVLQRLADAGWLPKIGTVMVQFHEWLPASHRRRRAIRRALSESHSLVWDYPWVWEMWRRDGFPEPAGTELP